MAFKVSSWTSNHPWVAGAADTRSVVFNAGLSLVEIGVGQVAGGAGRGGWGRREGGGGGSLKHAGIFFALSMLLSMRCQAEGVSIVTGGSPLTAVVGGVVVVGYQARCGEIDVEVPEG
jgi:hypothetical protein